MKPINKSAIVTGAAKRIGAGIAMALSSQGWFVYLHYNSSSEEAKEVLHEIKSSGGNGQLINMDLSYPDCGEQIINQIDKAAPPVELLINNAARFEYDNISNINSVSLDQHFFANVRGPILLSKAFFELVKKGSKVALLIFSIIKSLPSIPIIYRTQSVKPHYNAQQRHLLWQWLPMSVLMVLHQG